MTNRELLYIKTIAETHNITHAAQKLSVAQPSLTQSLQRMEKTLNCTLFDRRKNGLFLTEAGKLYYDTACKILSEWEALLSQLEQNNAQKGGTLKIGASWYHTLLVLTPMLPDYRRQFPLVNLQLTEQKSADLLQRLERRELDLILVHEYPAEYPAPYDAGDTGLLRLPLGEEPFCIVLPRKFALSGQEAGKPYPVLPPEALKGIPLIRFSPGQRIGQICDFVFDQAGFQPPAAITTYSFPSALELAASGLGAAILPEGYVRAQVGPDAPMQVFSIGAQYHAYWRSAAVYPAQTRRAPALEAFLECLKRDREKRRLR